MSHPVSAAPLRILLLSDLHGFLPAALPVCDMVLIAGDMCPTSDHSISYQASWIRWTLRPWLDTVAGVDEAGNLRPVIWTWGNHDFAGQSEIAELLTGSFAHPPTVDAQVEYLGLKIHASPWSNKFGSWAFMAREDKLEEIYARIPIDIDIVITHGPIKGLVDQTYWGNEHVGSQSLKARMLHNWARLHVCGHIHEAMGIVRMDRFARLPQLITVNASIRDIQYQVRGVAYLAQWDASQKFGHEVLSVKQVAFTHDEYVPPIWPTQLPQ